MKVKIHVEALKQSQFIAIIAIERQQTAANEHEHKHLLPFVLTS